MFVINGKVFLRFLPGFCVIIFAYVVSASFEVRDSRNKAQFAPSLRTPKKLFRATLIRDLVCQLGVHAAAIILKCLECRKVH